MAKIFTKLKIAFGSAAAAVTGQDPLMPVLKENTGLAGADLDLVGAKLGFILKVIYSDKEVDDGEREFLHNVIVEYTDLDAAKAVEVRDMLLSIDPSLLNLEHSAGVLVEKLEEAERKKLLRDLFSMAHADDDFHVLEEKDLQTITRYLQLNQFDFFAEKEAAKQQGG